MKKILTFLLTAAMLFSASTVYAADFKDGVGKDEIPYGNYNNSFAPYKYKTFEMLTEEEAKAAKVPSGYSGYVLKLTGGSGGLGVGLDLSQYPVKQIESITFRIHCPADTKSNGVRLAGYSKDNWLMLAGPGETGKWTEVTLTDKDTIAALDNGKGFGKATNFCIRYSGSSGVVYIDAITVNLREADTVPPVITYAGESHVVTTLGRKFDLGITAYDEADAADTPVEYVWSEGALDAKGELTEGEHSLTVKATDAFDNTAELSLTVSVGPRDTEAPKILFVSELTAPAGTRPVLNIPATDNVDTPAVKITWSKNALDARGRLVAGEHTLTVTAEDLTGNRSTHTVTVHVTETPTVRGQLIEMTPGK